MNVWIMNLIDNRDVKPDDLEISKFDFCKEKEIVGIGWTNYDSENTDNSAYLQADNAIESFEVNDLVWVKNPLAENETEKFFICQITEKAKSANDETMNKYDIGKYCSCKYYPVAGLPDDFEQERLTALHTIEKANDSVAEKTIRLFNSFNAGKSKNIKKKCIITIICAAVLILGIFVTLKTIGVINEMTHPILPKGLDFGMTFDEMTRNTTYIDTEFYSEDIINFYNPMTKDYIIIPKKSIFENFPIEISKDKIELFYFCLNEDKEFYKFRYEISEDKISDTDFDVLCDYYKKAFGKITYTKEENGVKSVLFQSDDIICIVDNLSVTLYSEKYEPKIREISKQEIAIALTSINYKVDGFSINLYTLLEECVSDMNIDYCSVLDAVHYNHSLKSDDDIVKKIKKDYPEYASTSYLISVHGDICQNPELPYMKKEDVDVIKLILIFDDNGNFIESIKFEECSDLQTFAVLYMFS